MSQKQPRHPAIQVLEYNPVSDPLSIRKVNNSESTIIMPATLQLYQLFPVPSLLYRCFFDNVRLTSSSPRPFYTLEANFSLQQLSGFHAQADRRLPSEKLNYASPAHRGEQENIFHEGIWETVSKRKTGGFRLPYRLYSQKGIFDSMDLINETLKFYDQNAEKFVSGTISADMSEAQSRFAACLPSNGLILDFGCGSGRDTKKFMDAGFRVDAVDGSKELCVLATAYTGITVKKMLFSDLDVCDRYDGIWACASILHLPRAELAEVIGKAEKALKHGGVLYASFKYGDHEEIRNGRYFTNFTEESLSVFWETFPKMKFFDCWVSRDVRADRKEERWINLMARRV